MFTLMLDDETAARLQALARQQNRTPNDVVRDLLEYVNQPKKDGNDNWALKMAQMAEEDTSIEWNESAANLSENSRNILDSEFADYLLKRTESNDE